MLFRIMLVAALLLAVAAAITIPVRLAAKTPIEPATLSRVTVGLLWLAGILSALMTLAIMAAAAWGMDTRLAWGLSVYPYLVPALSLPAFLLLRIASPLVLSRVLWFLTAACGVACYFGDRADRMASGVRLVSDPLENLGMFLNAFTILFVAISLLVQMAAVCRRREETQTKLVHPVSS